jgi:hypothetical protein
VSVPADAVGQAKPAPMPRDVPRTAGAAVRVFLSHSSPRALLLMLAAALAARIALGGWSAWDALIVAAVLAWWPLNEWLIHVFMLHYRPRMLFGRRIDFHLPRTHRQHHADPWHLPRVFIPRHIFPLTLPIFLLIVLLSPDRGLALSFVAMYLLLGLHYEWCHYLAHIGWCPPLSYYQRRVREHRLHHFRNENYWWGVSMGLADRLLGTAPDPAQVDRSGTTGRPVSS